LILEESVPQPTISCQSINLLIKKLSCNTTLMVTQKNLKDALLRFITLVKSSPKLPIQSKPYMHNGNKIWLFSLILEYQRFSLFLVASLLLIYGPNSSVEQKDLSFTCCANLEMVNRGQMQVWHACRRWLKLKKRFLPFYLALVYPFPFSLAFIQIFMSWFSIFIIEIFKLVKFLNCLETFVPLP